MSNQILRTEFHGSMLGVSGRFHNVIGEAGASTLASQTFISESRRCPSYGEHAYIRAEVRFDDNCRNGHNSFAITADIRDSRYRGSRGEIAGGCCHDEIAVAFPELAPLIRWHLTSSDGPMHYIANTVYHAGDRDHNGLRKGEKRQIRNGKTGELAWQLQAVNADGLGVSDSDTAREYIGAETLPLYLLKTSCDGASPPFATPQLRWVPWCRVGEGKARDLDAARRAAVWPDASDAELSVEPEQLKAALAKRHPHLVANFKADMLGAGLIWTDASEPAKAIELPASMRP
jgi:hypothetical protein